MGLDTGDDLSAGKGGEFPSDGYEELSATRKSSRRISAGTNIIHNIASEQGESIASRLQTN